MPNPIQAQIDEVLALLKANDFATALQRCESLAKINPDVADVQHLLGLVYAKNNKIAAARDAFERAIKLDPQQAIYHNNLSNTYKLLGNSELALRHLHEALRLSPNNAEAYNNLGSLYYSFGQIVDAIPLFEKTIRLNPLSWEAHFNLANCLIKQDMVLQAIVHYEKVLDLNPQHKAAKLNLSMALVHTNNYAAALPLLKDVAADNPKHAELQGHLAEAYLDLGKSEEAIEQYIKALALEPHRAAWHHNLAVLYMRNKQTDLARQHFQRTLELEPDDQTAQHMLTALSQGNSTQAPAKYVGDLFDQYASYYNVHISKQLKYQVPVLLRQAMSKYITGATKAINILDLGCGTGICGVYFRDLANFLVGVDISAAMLEQAKALGAYDGLCRCDILQTIPGYGRAAFDLIIAADVFVYIGDLEPLFKMLITALRPTGQIAFSVEDLGDDKQNYALQTSGRFAHSAKYISNVATKLGLQIGAQNQITLREQDQMAVPGLLYVLNLCCEDKASIS